MNRIAILSCFLLLVLALTQAHHANKSMHHGRFVSIKKPLNTVERATKQLIKARNHNDIKSSMRFIRKDTIIVYNSEVPFGGVYKGYRGAIEHVERLYSSFQFSNTSCRLIFADEGKGTSAIGCTRSGTFLRSNGTLTDAKTITFIRWSLGKISFMNTVDLDYSKIADAYRTKAEKAWFDMHYAMARCGGVCDDVLKFISDNATFQFSNLYPQRMTALTANINTTYKGVDGFKRVMNDFAGVINQVKKVNIIYGNDNTVVSASILGETTKLMALAKFAKQGFVSTGAYKPTVMYSITQFDDNGKMLSCEALSNRPLSPLDLWNVNKLKHNMTSTA